MEGNFRAVMAELGHPCEPSEVMGFALKNLSDGQARTEVMKRYRITIVAHGKPSREEIEAYQQHFIQGLGACPKSLR